MLLIVRLLSVFVSNSFLAGDKFSFREKSTPDSPTIHGKDALAGRTFLTSNENVVNKNHTAASHVNTSGDDLRAAGRASFSIPEAGAARPFSR